MRGVTPAIPRATPGHSGPTRLRTLQAAALTLGAAYLGCWVGNLIPWWAVLAYVAILTPAWAESD